MTPTPLAVGWGESLRRARKAFPTDDGHELTQTELAARAGCTQHTISRVENGIHKPADDLRISLARALNTTVEELFAYTPFVVEVVAVSDDKPMTKARIAAHTLHSQVDGYAITQSARDKAFERFEREVDPSFSLPDEERRRRAESLRRAHMSRLAKLSHAARRRNKSTEMKGPEMNNERRNSAP